jgi:hypothetical protein
MRVAHRLWTTETGWSSPLGPDESTAQLVLSFGPVTAPGADWFDHLAAHCPHAAHVYVSGGGQISFGTIEDDATVVAFVTFADTKVHAVRLDGASVERSHPLGAALGDRLRTIDGLRHVLAFSEGIRFNGGAFLDGLNARLPEGVTVSGGMASNGTALTDSVVGLNGPPARGQVIAIGLAGDRLAVGTGSVGGWEYFGPERIATRVDGTVLHELDGERALDVYTRYLGQFASELPGSALLFPLAVQATDDGPVAVRTCLHVDEAAGTLRFAGDIPPGSRVRLMRTTPDRLVDGAAQAAALARTAGAPVTPGGPDHDATHRVLTLCVSCIGRRAVLRSRTEEELEEVVRESGSAVVVGCYSNGELAPPSDGRAYRRAVLHNQTMTVTTLSER